MRMSTSLPRLLQLCSQALPVGAYAYSQGLESAISGGVVTDRTSAGQWIGGVLRHSLAELDVPALMLAYRAWNKNDAACLYELDQYLQASRETGELLLEDIEMGRSLQRLLNTLEVPSPHHPTPSFVTRFALAGAHWDIDEAELVTGFCFSWLENQLAVAIKSVPLGQSDAQLLLGELMPVIDEAYRHALMLAVEAESGLWNFGLSLPGLARLSSHHETLDGRLYRS